MDARDIETLQELQELYRRELEARARESLARCAAGLAEAKERPLRGWLAWRTVRGQA